VLNKLLDDIFDYEQSIDGEYCCHSDKQIRQGMCEATKPEDIEAIRHMAEFWGGPPKRIQEED
jgi:hypothetical protein